MIALLKLEAGAAERWLVSFPTWKLEHALSPTRMGQLDTCIPLPGAQALRQAMLHAAHLGREAYERLAAQYEWSWPQDAAEAVIQMVSEV